jgi:hypothetical protein
VLTAAIGLAAAATSAWFFRPVFLLANLALFVAGLLYNLPPLRLKDRPFLDALVESLTNPIRVAIGWYAVAPAAVVPTGLLLTVWTFGAFLMSGKRLAELRLLGATAAEYRPTFRAYTVRSLLTVQLAYALVGLGAMAVFLAGERPQLLVALPLVAGLLAWAVKMTFQRDSPLIDPEHLYRRPGFLLVSCAVLATLVALAL